MPMFSENPGHAPEKIAQQKLKLTPNQAETDYQQSAEFLVELRGRRLQFCSKPGLPSFDLASPSATLLAELLQFMNHEQVLWLGCGHGAALAALALGYPECTFWAADQSFIAVRMTECTAALNKLQNIHALPESELLHWPSERYDCAVIDLPKGRRLLQRWLVQAFYGLKTGGTLYLAGANDLGIQAAVKDAQQLFGRGAILGYKKGNRVLRCIKHTPQPPLVDWADADGTRQGSWIEHTLQIPGLSAVSLTIRSLPGVFSAGELDAGTALLLQHLHIPAGGAVLDPGCGCGVIGCYAGLNGAGSVDFLDVDLLAVACTRENIALNRLAESGVACRVFASDLLEAVQDRRYDLIAVNPPFHSGKQTNYQIVQALIRQSLDHLNPGGKLVLVANLFLRYENLIQAQFGHVQTLAEDGKFHVLQATWLAQRKNGKKYL